jgi:predicted aldo/keto reductase-like oxidoreductase
MPAIVSEAAARCGVNYWHKANQWDRDEIPRDVLKNREAHYCQVTVDRVGGNNETGRIDEESHVSYVREALKQTGLRYFDDMQFHFGYHNVAEVRENRGVIRAFERLKKEGLVKHLCLSQHGYAGNSRVPRGEEAAQILTAIMEDGIYEHAQPMYSYGADPELEKFLEAARQKGFGIIAMKTTRGIGRMKDDRAFMNALPKGTTPHNALTRWLTTSARIDAAIIRVSNLGEFVDTFSGAGKSLRAGDAQLLNLMAARANQTACRLCTKCQPHCAQQVPIAEILRFERYALDYKEVNLARKLYAGLDRQADACKACGNCVAHCPIKLAIPEKLAAVHTLLA